MVPGRMITGDSEKRFSQRVFDLARLCGWLAARYPTFRPTGTTPGFPDLVLVHHGWGRLIFAELKMPKGRLSAAQDGWLAALRAVPGVEVYVWYPSDWDAIEMKLMGE